MLSLILISVCILVLIFVLRIDHRRFWKKKNIFSVDNLLWTFFTSNKSIPEIAKEIYDKHDVTHIGSASGNTPVLILKDIEDVQATLAGDFQSFYCRGININPSDLLADNVLFMNDFRRWKLMRTRLSPVFTSTKLKNMFSILDKCGNDFVKFVDENHEKRNPFNILMNYTTASIGAAVFGIDTRTKNAMDSPFLDMAWKSIEPSLKVTMSVTISNMYPSLFKLLNLKIFGDHEDFFIGVVKDVLKARKHSNEKRHDFIDTCLELQKNCKLQDPSTGYEINLTDEIVAAQAFFFFIAGADTTANTMNFTLLELASNPEILKKVHDEIDNIFTSDKNELSYDDTEKMQYLDMVINEAMRKYPAIGFIQRKCTKDTVLPSNVAIEKDVVVGIPVFAIHRDPKHYPNPDLFDPERFRPKNVSNIKKFAYMPFGEGNRICLGARFARLQMKAGLAWLLRRYTLVDKNYKVQLEKSVFGIRDPLTQYGFKLRE